MRLRAASELEKCEAALERERDEHRQAGIVLEQALARREELAEDASAYEKNERFVHTQQGELARREIVIARRERDVEEAKRRLAQATFRAAYAEAEAAYAAAAEKSKRFGKLRAELAKVGAEVVQTRSAADEAKTRAIALCPAEIEFELPPSADEPQWPDAADLKEVVKVIEAGPRRPRDDLVASHLRHEMEKRSREAGQIRDAVRDMRQGARTVALRRLPKHLHPEANRRFLRELEEFLNSGQDAEERVAMNPTSRRQLEQQAEQIRAELEGKQAEPKESVHA